MRLKLSSDRVIVKEDKQEYETPGGLILARSGGKDAKGRQKQVAVHRGYVVEVGPGRVAADGTRVPPLVKVGDYVWFDLDMGVEFRWRDEHGRDEMYLFIDEGNIMGIEDPDGEWTVPAEMRPPAQAIVAGRVFS